MVVEPAVALLPRHRLHPRELRPIYAEFSIVALVLTLVIIAGEIDLSPASIDGALGLPLRLCLQGRRADRARHGWSARSRASSWALFNALLVIGLQLPSIIVTIGTLTLYRGLAQMLAGDKSISKFPKWFIGIDYRLCRHVPVPVIIFVVVSIVLGLVLGTTISGRQIYQIGTNEIAAQHAGIRVRRIKFRLFVAMGFASAIAGLITASRLASVRYDHGHRRRAADGADGRCSAAPTSSAAAARSSARSSPPGCWSIIATGMTVANIAVDLAADRDGRVCSSSRSSRPTRSTPAPKGSGSPPANRHQQEEHVLKRTLLAGLALGLALAGDAPPSRPTRFQIVYIPKNTGNPYFDSLEQGFKDGCAKVGCDFDDRRARHRRGDLADPVHHSADAARRQRHRHLAQQPRRHEPGARPRPGQGHPGARRQRRPRRQLRPSRRRHPAGRLHQDRPGPGRAARLDDRLRGRHRHPVGHHRRARPEHLDRGDEGRRSPEQPEIRQDEARRDRLRRRRAAEVDHRGGGAAVEVPEPRRASSRRRPSASRRPRRSSSPPARPTRST